MNREFGVDLDPLPPLSQREQHVADFRRKRSCYQFLEAWAKFERMESIKFRGLDLKDFDVEHLTLLCEYLGSKVIRERNSMLGLP